MLLDKNDLLLSKKEFSIKITKLKLSGKITAEQHRKGMSWWQENQSNKPLTPIEIERYMQNK